MFVGLIAGNKSIYKECMCVWRQKVNSYISNLLWFLEFLKSMSISCSWLKLSQCWWELIILYICNMFFKYVFKFPSFYPYVSKFSCFTLPSSVILYIFIILLSIIGLDLFFCVQVHLIHVHTSSCDQINVTFLSSI